MSNSTAFEVVGYGPIVFADEELGVLITINGAYLNWWNSDGKGGFVNVDCRSGHPDLYTLTVATAMDLAKAWFEEAVNEAEEEE